MDIMLKYRRTTPGDILLRSIEKQVHKRRLARLVELHMHDFIADSGVEDDDLYQKVKSSLDRGHDLPWHLVHYYHDIPDFSIKRLMVVWV